VASYYFGSEAHGTRSSTGEKFAGLVQREIVARTDLLDLRPHAKTWDFLRKTRMPAVRLDLGYLTNAGDAARLAHPGSATPSPRRRGRDPALLPRPEVDAAHRRAPLQRAARRRPAGRA
jgi:hypothetical protein